MDLPQVRYKIKGLALPDELSALGILGFILRDGVKVTTADNRLTTEQVRAIATFLQNYPYRTNKQSIRKWAKDYFNPEEKMTDEVREYVIAAKIDPRLIIDPFGLITLSEAQTS